MDQLIEFKKYPLTSKVLDRLLQDKTTKRNIIWATDSYKELGEKYSDRFEITRGALKGIDPILIQPRAFKDLEDQQQRTKSKAEVFTPPWIINKMINHLDEDWFEQKDIFNQEAGQTWTTTKNPVPFTKKSWKKYVTQKVLEITCGEAPFIVSRYNASTGEIIPLEDRIGILDRKMRVINENTDTELEWRKWAEKAFKSVFGYEYQGDNLLIGRCNLLSTFADYYTARWKRQADEATLIRIANIIAWNFWQMDGLTGTIPLGLPQREFIEQTLFEDSSLDNDTFAPKCRIQDWNKQNRSILFQAIDEKEEKNMGRKFDVVIGNPPYQDDTELSSRKSPVYNKFMDAAFKIADTVELITPGRFLFNAGQTPKHWNEERLQDPYFSVLHYEPDGMKIFPNTDIKGGIAITIRNEKKISGPIDAFTAFPELNSILRKVTSTHSDDYLDSLVSSQGVYRFSKSAFTDDPSLQSIQGKGTGFKIVSKSFSKDNVLFHDKKPLDDQNYIQLLGLSNKTRKYRYINRKYIEDNKWIDTYNVLVPEANGSGALGEVLSTPLIGTPLIGTPLIGTTDTFLSIGSYKNEDEAANLLKYIKTKFSRALLGIKKATQHNPKSTWVFVPIQDFTPASDIDWTRPIPEIDQQLYKKYKLSPDEIEFIETHVKEME
ncbi:Eco57I restriction-modification methylase domain-containing protein [Faecalibaculum rodentium]|uniref:Eco57I restriction-modification methylase domain-containing protein n=1 Tax=Faecalibaculum rodentium TaxID=1702221 RepID=UPI00256EB61E|nr:Eco57I restriction-modification methylase domain-containing protein [Faecalibaculum rodentium]